MRPALLVLNSTSLHFPNRYDEALAQAGHPVERHDSVDSFLQSRRRAEPFLALFEIGSSEDLERALIAYDWAETVQPLAPARFLLLLGSRNIELGERRRRFSSAEILVLPLPAKNLLFKIDLQLRLLQSETPRAPEGFFAIFEGEPKAPHESRVLVMRGPGPGRGAWKAVGSTPEGKVRWRWVGLPQKEEEPVKVDLSWEAVSQKEPVFDESRKGWVVEDDKPDLRCFRQEKEVFSARRAEQERAKSLSTESQRVGAENEMLAKEKISAAPRAPEEPNKANSGNASPLGARERGAKAESEQEKAEAEKTSAPPQPKAAEPAAKARAVLDEIRREKETKQHPAQESAPWNAPDPKGTKPDPFPYGTPSYAKDPGENVSPETAGPVEGRVEGRQKPGNAPESKPEKERLGAAPEGTAKSAVHSTLGSSSGERVSSFTPSGEAAPPKEESAAPHAVVGNPKLTGLDPTRISGDSPGREPGHLSGGESQESNVDFQGAEPESNSSERRRAEKGAREQGRIEGKEHAPVVEEIDGARADRSLRRDTAPEAPRMKEKKISSQEQTPSAGDEKQIEAPVTEVLEKKKRESEPKILAPTEVNPSNPAIEIPEGAAKKSHAWTVKGKAGESDDSVTVKGSREKGAETPPSEGQSLLASRLFLTMTLAELKDEESSWHPVDRYRVYLSARHRYYGVKDVEEYFPLWVYEGELAPEFLDKTRGWKFYDRLPEAHYSLESLPKPVAAYLRKAAGLPEGEEESASIRRTLPSTGPKSLGRENTPEANDAPAPHTNALQAVWAAIRKLLGL